MHPQIRQPNPGRCPLCGMDLVKINDDAHEDDSDAPVLKVSRRAAALMEIQTSPAERRHVEAELRFLGKFAYDETRLFDIVTRTEGQIERLFVNYTGVPVRKGEHIAEIYSPEVFATSQELLLARNAAARTKLRLLHVGETEIEEILRTGQPMKTFTLYSPVTGVLTELGGRQGVWLMKGERVAQIADISSLWILLDAYETDIALIHYGQQVSLEVPAFPGREVTGFVAYVSPDLDERTRTIKVRVNVPNPDGALRPGMFARARLRVPLTADGQAYGPKLAGKWICPMHPEVTGDQAGDCNICGMPLESADTFGYVHAEEEVSYPLVIPASAPLITGKRAVVYVQLPDREQPTFEGRTVTLGHRAGDAYIVLDGLREGERVVTHGNFKIDSELQIRGRPSMMAPEQPRGADKPLSEIAQRYLDITAALARDSFEASLAAVAAMDDAVRRSDAPALQEVLRAMRKAGDIETMREHLVALTEHTERAVVATGTDKLYRAHCPMAFGDKGADWLQADRQILNPYFGASMLRCGVIKGEVR